MKTSLKMIDIKKRVYLNDSKSHVRQKLNLQSKKKDESFCTFEMKLSLISILFHKMN